jgi:murein DD-endopeptidase MepM/ murein hydrolase activator NlpD
LLVGAIGFSWIQREPVEVSFSDEAGAQSGATTPDQDADKAENKNELTAPAAGEVIEPRIDGPSSALLKPFSIRETDRVRAGETLSAAMARHNVTGKDANLIIDSLKKLVNLRGVKRGDALIFEYAISTGEAEQQLAALEYVTMGSIGAPVRYRATRSAGQFLLSRYEPDVKTSVKKLQGRVSGSLYGSMLSAGGDASLVSRFTEFFGHQVDFYRDAQKDDAFKILVETRHADGRFIGYGKVLAAEYNNAGRRYRGFYYASEDGRISGIYDEKGRSLVSGVLTAPMDFARITSKFGSRFHPIQKRMKPHNGVDYGARVGTPFWSVADGVVVEARYSSSAGNMIRVRHKGGVVTEYFHAKSIAKGIYAGARVRQKQVLGYVGTTGNSTGPHLHFGMLVDGRYTNPSKRVIPAGDPVPQRHLTVFRSKVAPMVAHLENESLSQG